ncbi:hypothetical protein Cus16_2937 [Curtobacterium sp. ER1/6]|nr:hypothetical protein Cus16_2937 [Curtobacterium sp. ER1/6]
MAQDRGETLAVLRVVTAAEVPADPVELLHEVLDDHRHVVRRAPGALRQRRLGLEQPHGERLRALLALHDAVLQARAGLDRGGSVRQRGRVQEHGFAVVAGDEPEALLLVVELDLAGGHAWSPRGRGTAVVRRISWADGQADPIHRDPPRSSGALDDVQSYRTRPRVHDRWDLRRRDPLHHRHGRDVVDGAERQRLDALAGHHGDPADRSADRDGARDRPARHHVVEARPREPVGTLIPRADRRGGR